VAPPVPCEKTAIARPDDHDPLSCRPVTSELDIARLRSEIDKLDGQILEFVARRISLVRLIGEYKRAHGLPVYDAEREREVLQRLTQAAPPELDPHVVRRVFERIIDESRGIEQHWVVKE
jgi:chorismate mutase